MKLGLFVIPAILAEYDDLGNKKKGKKPSKSVGKGFTCKDTLVSTCKFLADQTTKVTNEDGDEVPKYDGIEGTLTLTQQECDNGINTLKIQGSVACPNGLCDDDGSDNNHGFHVHTYGRVTNAKENQCGTAQTGGHFYNYDGSIDIGDSMGKAIYDGTDTINVDLTSSSLSLLDYAEGYVGRRSLVMHMPSGHTDSGARIGCCTIPEPSEGPDGDFEDTCEDGATAVCDFQPDGTQRTSASGKIKITERNCGGTTKVRFEGSLDCPGCGNEKMGFHVHGAKPFTDQDAETGFSCAATGGHFTNGDQEHGLAGESTTFADGFHYGALGNVFMAVDNRINVDITSDRLSFEGADNGILNKGMVLHGSFDKGRLFQSSGDSGPRIACCKIVADEPEEPSYGFCGVEDLNAHFDVRYGYDFSNCSEGKSKCKVKCKLGGKSKPKKITCKNGQIYPSSIRGCEDARDPL